IRGDLSQLGNNDMAESLKRNLGKYQGPKAEERLYEALRQDFLVKCPVGSQINSAVSYLLENGGYCQTKQIRSIAPRISCIYEAQWPVYRHALFSKRLVSEVFARVFYDLVVDGDVLTDVGVRFEAIEDKIKH